LLFIRWKVDSPSRSLCYYRNKLTPHLSLLSTTPDICSIDCGVRQQALEVRSTNLSTVLGFFYRASRRPSPHKELDLLILLVNNWL